MDNEVYRFDPHERSLTRIATLPADAFLGQIVPFEGMVLVHSGQAQETETGSSVELIDVIGGSSFVIAVPDVGDLMLEAATQDLLLLRGRSTETRFPVVAAYRFNDSEVAWTLDLVPDPVPEIEPDELIPGIFSMIPSPEGDQIVVSLAYPTSTDFDVLITAQGAALTDAYDADGSLVSELHDPTDLGAGWIDSSKLLYIPLSAPGYTVDTDTGNRNTIQLPDIVKDQGFSGIYVSGTGAQALISGTNGLSLVDLDTELVTLLAAGPCNVLVGQLN